MYYRNWGGLGLMGEKFCLCAFPGGALCPDSPRQSKNVFSCVDTTLYRRLLSWSFRLSDVEVTIMLVGGALSSTESVLSRLLRTPAIQLSELVCSQVGRRLPPVAR